jgi:hypothetical protein
VWRDVVAPVLLTRAGLLLVGWLSQAFPRNPFYPSSLVVGRGWGVSPWRLLDVWARWDSGWYMGIVQDGYQLRGPVASSQSNFAFFPLYPYLVRGLAMLLPTGARTEAALLVIGLLVSNACLVGGLVLVRRLVAAAESDVVARRTVLFLILSPAGFFFSCFFTESLFLLISAAALLAAYRGRWWAAGVLGGLLALTRPNGVLIAAPLAFAYLAARRWRLRHVGPEVGWLLLVPAGLLGYMVALLPITGDLLAPVKIQAAWGKVTSAPWDTLLEPRYPYPVTTAVERVIIVVLLVLAVRAFWLLRDRSHAVYAAVFLAAPLFTGVLNSQARYAAPLFPLFAALAHITGRRRTEIAVAALLAVAQAAAFAAWCQLYWVG